MPRPSLVVFIILAVASLCLLGPYVGVHIITTPVQHEESPDVTAHGKSSAKSHDTVDEIEELLSQ